MEVYIQYNVANNFFIIIILFFLGLVNTNHDGGVLNKKRIFCFITCNNVLFYPLAYNFINDNSN